MITIFDGIDWRRCDPGRAFQGRRESSLEAPGSASLASHGPEKPSLGHTFAPAFWNTGLIGIAVAFDRFEVAALMAGINFLTLRYVRDIKSEIEDGSKD